MGRVTVSFSSMFAGMTSLQPQGDLPNPSFTAELWCCGELCTIGWLVGFVWVCSGILSYSLRLLGRVHRFRKELGITVIPPKGFAGFLASICWFWTQVCCYVSAVLIGWTIEGISTWDEWQMSYLLCVRGWTVPPLHHSYVEDLTPSTSQCEDIWRQGL